MKPKYRFIRCLGSMVASLLLLTGCAGLTPQQLTTQVALEPADSSLWRALEEKEQENWFHLLNEGPEALDWRLRAIDSAGIKGTEGLKLNPSVPFNLATVCSCEQNLELKRERLF